MPSRVFFFFSEVEVKSLKESIGWARREQTQPQICLSCSRGGWGGGFLIKSFWILISKGDGGSNKVKIKNKSFMTLTFSRTEPPENKRLSLAVSNRPGSGFRQKVTLRHLQGDSHCFLPPESSGKKTNLITGTKTIELWSVLHIALDLVDIMGCLLKQACQRLAKKGKIWL